MRIVKLPKALTDLIETADRFFDPFEDSIEAIRRTPKIGKARSYENTQIRMWFVKGFEKCLIFYTKSPDEIVVLRVIHSARDYTRFFASE